MGRRRGERRRRRRTAWRPAGRGTKAAAPPVAVAAHVANTGASSCGDTVAGAGARGGSRRWPRAACGWSRRGRRRDRSRPRAAARRRAAEVRGGHHRAHPPARVRGGERVRATLRDLVAGVRAALPACRRTRRPGRRSRSALAVTRSPARRTPVTRHRARGRRRVVRHHGRPGRRPSACCPRRRSTVALTACGPSATSARVPPEIHRRRGRARPRVGEAVRVAGERRRSPSATGWRGAVDGERGRRPGRRLRPRPSSETRRPAPCSTRRRCATPAAVGGEASSTTAVERPDGRPGRAPSRSRRAARGRPGAARRPSWCPAAAGTRRVSCGRSAVQAYSRAGARRDLDADAGAAHAAGARRSSAARSSVVAGRRRAAASRRTARPGRRRRSTTRSTPGRPAARQWSSWFIESAGASKVSNACIESGSSSGPWQP